jgi:hypothetical protein
MRTSSGHDGTGRLKTMKPALKLNAGFKSVFLES